jgi:hypothetical protein
LPVLGSTFPSATQLAISGAPTINIHRIDCRIPCHPFLAVTISAHVRRPWA